MQHHQTETTNATAGESSSQQGASQLTFNQLMRRDMLRRIADIAELRAWERSAAGFDAPHYVLSATFNARCDHGEHAAADLQCMGGMAAAW